MMGRDGFRPCAAVRNRHVQSVLASVKLRVLAKRSVLEPSEERIVDTPSGARLVSRLLRHPRPKGLIILLHGWEGSSSSTYMIEAGVFYNRLGYSVCRLDLRDHGDSHHLNEGLFHGALLDETFEAVDALAALSEGGPAYLLGFSLGGNFALRIARRYSDLGRCRLEGVFAVSPPLDPYKTTLAIDHGLWIYRDYFLKKWKRSLRKKQELFPQTYDFRDMLGAGSCIELTERVMRRYSMYPTYRVYFDQYTLRDPFFRDLRVPVTIFIAADDPVIPVEDFDALSEHGNLRVFRTEHGGHCGFVDLFPMRCWYNEVIAGSLAGPERSPDPCRP